MADLTPAAYFPEDCIITIQQKGGTATTITTRVTNFTDGGGGRDTDSVTHFGGAYLTVRKPRDEYEVSFDVDINDTLWAEVMGGSLYGAGSTFGSAFKVESVGVQKPYKIKLEWFDPEEADAVGSTVGSDYGAGFKILYYNSYGVEYTKDNAAEDRLMGTVRFNISAADNNGSAQNAEIECQNFQDETGSGSYVDWESSLDTTHGY